MIAGTNSGCGKTSVTLAVMQAFINRKKEVASFKCGPDYIDPMFHTKVVGTHARNLDAIFCEPDELKYILDKNQKDICVIEGVMGFYDGIKDKGSSYQVATSTDTSVILVVDAKGMSASIGAVIKGFLTYHSDSNIIGFIFNRLPHSLVEQTKEICNELQTTFFGYLPFEKEASLSSRHLGLVTADEIIDLKKKVNLLGGLAEKYIDLDAIYDAALATDYEDRLVLEEKAQQVKIAVAHDEAFCFLYEDNLDMLRLRGAKLIEFSPLRDKHLPEGIDGLILPGGYPELYAKELSENETLKAEIKEAYMSQMPIYAECGGFLYLGEKLDGKEMVGALKGEGTNQNHLVRFGYVKLEAKEDSLFLEKGQKQYAHEFHYYDSTENGSGMNVKKCSNDSCYECAYVNSRLYAGFPHLYFGTKTKYADRLIEKCMEYQNETR